MIHTYRCIAGVHREHSAHIYIIISYSRDYNNDIKHLNSIFPTTKYNIITTTESDSPNMRRNDKRERKIEKTHTSARGTLGCHANSQKKKIIPSRHGNVTRSVEGIYHEAAPYWHWPVPLLQAQNDWWQGTSSSARWFVSAALQLL